MVAPTTAHILGGCIMGKTADEGMVDHQGRIIGYPGLYVADGSVIPRQFERESGSHNHRPCRIYHA